MTTEHKILALIDRGVTRLADIFRIVGDDAAEWIGDLQSLGVVEGIMPVDPFRADGCHMKLTAKGVERLDELDEKGAAG